MAVRLKGSNSGVESFMESFESGLYKGEKELNKSKNPSDGFVNIVVFSSEKWEINLVKQILIELVISLASGCIDRHSDRWVRFLVSFRYIKLCEK